MTIMAKNLSLALKARLVQDTIHTATHQSPPSSIVRTYSVRAVLLAPLMPCAHLLCVCSPPSVKSLRSSSDRGASIVVTSLASYVRPSYLFQGLPP